MSNFADRVRERRAELKLNQAVVARIAGLKQPDVSKIEKGLIQETTKIVGLAKALRCRPEWLLTGKGERDPATSSSAILISEAGSFSQSSRDYDEWTQGAINVMLSLKPYQREGALAALRTYVGNLAPPRDGQTLSMAA